MHPHWAEQILNGVKTVELRRRTPSISDGRAVIYATAPLSSVLAAAAIADVVEMPLPDLWRQFSDAACITRSDFDAYFEGKDIGTAITLEDIDIWPAAVAMSVVQAELEISPVQGWRYIAPEVTDALTSRGLGRSSVMSAR